VACRFLDEAQVELGFRLPHNLKLSVTAYIIAGIIALRIIVCVTLEILDDDI
jgi:hypothetical protein